MKLYRYEDCRLDGVAMREFEVLRETPKGYWIYTDRHEKWVSNNGVKRFAYPDESAALLSYVERKRRQVEILGAQLKMARLRLESSEAFAKGKIKTPQIPMPRASVWGDHY